MNIYIYNNYGTHYNVKNKIQRSFVLRLAHNVCVLKKRRRIYVCVKYKVLYI